MQAHCARRARRRAGGRAGRHRHDQDRPGARRDRSLGLSSVRRTPRVVIIDHADALGVQAQDAILKTLEEPPSASVFVLITDRPDVLLPTVRSRCQRLRFGPLSPADVAARAGPRPRHVGDRGARGRGRRGWQHRPRARGQRRRRDEARDARRRAAQGAATSNDPLRRLEGAKALVGAGTADRDELSRRLLALSSLHPRSRPARSRAPTSARSPTPTSSRSCQSLLRSLRRRSHASRVRRRRSRARGAGSQRESQDRRRLAGPEYMKPGWSDPAGQVFCQRQVHARRPDGVVPAAGSADRRAVPGHQVVVSGRRPGVGTVTRSGRSSPNAASRRRIHAVVVRRATRDDIVQRLKQQQREQEPTTSGS